MVDMLLMLIVPSFMAFYYYGPRTVLLEGLSVAAAVSIEWSARKLMRCKNTTKDLSAVFTGAVTALLLPACAPLWMPMVGSAFAILVAKIPFGKAEKAPFVPAAAGIAFLTICWTDIIFIYPEFSSTATVWHSEGFVAGQSLTAMLSLGKSITPNWFSAIDIIVGRVSGPMGGTCMIVLFFMAVYLFIRRPRAFITSFGFMAAVAVMAILFPRVHTGRKISLLMEIASGMTVFAALLFVTDPSTVPERMLSRAVYGFTGGVLAMLLRYFGPYEDGACFAVMLLNAIWTPVDEIVNEAEYKLLKKIKEGRADG